VLVYPAGIDLSNSTLRRVTRLLTEHRGTIGSWWRRLSAAHQALLALAHLRCGDTYARLAAGFDIGIATLYRYIRETVDLPAALAPTSADAVRTAQAKAYVILDGTLLLIDRIAADRPYYSGKHKRHGTNVQVLADPLGRLIWASPALPGAVHDLTAARTHSIISALTTVQVRVWADKGGAGGTVTVSYRGRWSTLSQGKRAVNRAHAKFRVLGEQANAMLKGWHLLRKLRCSTHRITAIVQAVLSLHLTTTN
jgi:hypothetical protein